MTGRELEDEPEDEFEDELEDDHDLGPGGAADPGVMEAARLLDAGRAQDALRILRGLLADTPDDPVVLQLVAHAHLDLARPDEALAAARAAVAADVDDVAAWIVLARSYATLGQGHDALEAAQQAAWLAPQSPHAWAAVATSAPGTSEAVDAGRRAVALAPTSAAAHRALGVAVLPLDPTLAEQAFANAQRLDPASAGGLAAIGRARVSRGRLLAAADALVGAARTDPRYLAALQSLAVVVRRLLLVAHAAVLGGLLLVWGVLDPATPLPTAHRAVLGAAGWAVLVLLAVAVGVVLARRAPRQVRTALRTLVAASPWLRLWIGYLGAVLLLTTALFALPAADVPRVASPTMLLTVVLTLVFYVAARPRHTYRVDERRETAGTARGPGLTLLLAEGLAAPVTIVLAVESLAEALAGWSVVVGLTVLVQVLRVQRLPRPLRDDVVRLLRTDRASRLLLATGGVGLVAVPALAVAAASTTWAGWLWLVVWVPFLAAARFAGVLAEVDDAP